MILVADSGSTKTSWVLAGEGREPKVVNTIGLNPRTTPSAVFGSTFKAISQQAGSQSVDRIWYYGAGCGTHYAQNVVRCHLEEYFPQAEIVVDSDLMGACKATLGDKAGLVGILGTGSNACYFNGEHIINRLPSLGYILGDEGSGNHIGRLLLKSYFDGTMPKHISILFQEKYNIDYENEINAIYRQPEPNAHLAGFAPFANEHRKDKFVGQLLREAFAQYFLKQVQPLGEGPISLVGSVAYHFQPEIIEVANGVGIDVVEVVRTPIMGILKNLNVNNNYNLITL